MSAFDETFLTFANTVALLVVVEYTELEGCVMFTDGGGTGLFSSMSSYLVLVPQSFVANTTILFSPSSN